MLRSLARKLWMVACVSACSSNSDTQAPIDGDFEGIEEASEGLTDLSAQCTFVSGTGVATLALASGDVALVAKASSNLITVNGYPCAAGAVNATNLKKLVVTGAGGDEVLIIDQMGGTFAPGVSGAVGIDVDLGGGTGDAFKMRGAKTADTYVFGSGGAAWNADAFKDIAFANVETFVVSMTDGADSFSGAGNAATGGAAFATAVTVYGGAGNDTLRGGAGDDTLHGGDNDDTFNAGAAADGADVMNGNAGTDTADYSARTTAVTVVMDAMANDGGASEGDTVATDVEVVKGGSANDTLTGGAAAETFYGGAGDDTLTGGGGNDVLNGEAGDDTFAEGSSSNGADVMNGGAGTDTVDYSSRTAAVTVNLDTTANDGESGEADKVVNDVENVKTGSAGDTITGSASDNVLDGGGGADTINGGLGNDTLRGGAGNDTLNGDAGDDTFDEGSASSGDDSIHGGAGVDKVTYAARTNALTVVMDGTTAGGESGEADLIFTDVEDLIGGSAADTITGNAADNQLEGGTGSVVDTINGLAGEDLIDGGAGTDVIDCGAGDADILHDLTATATNCEL